eukprot:s5176_g1.t5
MSLLLNLMRSIQSPLCPDIFLPENGVKKITAQCDVSLLGTAARLRSCMAKVKLCMPWFCRGEQADTVTERMRSRGVLPRPKTKASPVNGSPGSPPSRASAGRSSHLRWKMTTGTRMDKIACHPVTSARSADVYMKLSICTCVEPQERNREHADSNTQTASQQYQALLQMLRREQEAADSQLRNLLQEAARKQNQLHELGGEGAILNMPEVSKLPTMEGLATALLSWAEGGSKTSHLTSAAVVFTGSAFGGFFPTKLSDPRHAMAVWKPDVLCDGVLASARMQWLVENRGLNEDAAQARVMSEFPASFGAGRRWNPDESCAGVRAEDRARWLAQNHGMSEVDAQRKVMEEFPQLFILTQEPARLQTASGTRPPKLGYACGQGELQGSPEANPPSWPSSVKILSTASCYDVVDQIYQEMAPLDSQFSSSRYALLFEASPKMHEVDVRVGFYTSVYGLGRKPSDTKIRSVTSTNETPHPELGSLQNFWRSLGFTAVPLAHMVTGINSAQRSAENFQSNCHPTYTCGGRGGMLWAVSQAAPLRRVVVDDNLCLSYFRLPPEGVKASDPRYPKQGACLEYDGWVKLGYRDPVADFASGGFMANVEVRGTVSFGSQQQFFARNCSAKSWDGGAWSCVFVGCSGAPHREQVEAASKCPIYTSVATSQVIAEKPFIIMENDGRYKLVVPSAMTDRSGTNFEVAEEEIRDFSAVYVAQPSKLAAAGTRTSLLNSAAEINKKLAEGKDVVFAPGIYKLDETIHVQRSCQVLLALGFATLVAPTDSPCIVVKDDAVGVRISGIMLEAAYRPLEASSAESTSTGPKALLQWGCGKDARSDPTVPASWGFLHDCFARVGGQEAPFTVRDELDPTRKPTMRPDSSRALFQSEARCSTMVQIQSPCVVGDNLWLWRADHWLSDRYLVYNHENRCETGLHVGHDARYVTMYGLFVEHTLGDMTYWEGEDGTTFFYQSELPYDAMDADASRKVSTTPFSGSGYRVADSVQRHTAHGVGVYCYFRDYDIIVPAGIRTPDGEGIKFRNAFTKWLNGGPKVFAPESCLLVCEKKYGCIQCVLQKGSRRLGPSTDSNKDKPHFAAEEDGSRPLSPKEVHLQARLTEAEEAQAQMEAETAKLLESAESDKVAFGHELRALQRSVRSELDASSDTALPSARQARLAAQLGEMRIEREQAVQELRAVQGREAELRKDLESGRRELKKAREAHQIEVDLLAAELQQFQDEQWQLEGKLRNCEAQEPILRARAEEAQAQVLEESRIGRRSLQRQLRTFEARERETELAAEQFRQEQQHLVAQLADVEAKLVVTKEQLQKAREDKLSDRQRLERQLDKFRNELGEQRQLREAVEKEKTYVELGGNRQHQEHTAQIRILRSTSKQLTARLDCLESSSESQQRDHAASEAEAARHREALEERAQAAETWGQELARRLQEAEDRHRQLSDEKEAHHRQSHGHITEAHSFMSRLLQALGHKADELVAFVSGHCHAAEEEMRTCVELEHLKASGESPEALVTRAFAGLSQTLALLARENTELRAGAGTPTSATVRRRAAAANATDVTVSEVQAKMAGLQKELIKLREHNQDLELERNQLRSSSGNGSASQEAEAALADMKQRMKSLSQAKRRAEERVEEHQQEITRQARAHQADLERLQLDIATQQQQQLEEKDHLKGKLSGSERRIRMLEAKLKGRVETQRVLQAEKEAVEEQLRIAAKQLEALLADESKETDLLRDLTGLSKQFDQLHAKHRAQLISAAEQAQLLQAEQAMRKELEAKFCAAQASWQAKEGEAVAWQKHSEVLEKDLGALRADKAASDAQVERLSAAQGESRRLVEELQKEMKRLREELQEVQKNEPLELLLRLKRLEEELQESETARRHLERERKRRPGSRSAGFSAVLEDDENQPPPTKPEAGPVANAGKTSVISALDEIQERLAAREKALHEAKISLKGPGTNAPSEPQAATKGQQGQPSLAELERDFGAYARSVGFKGDVNQLWEEAQAVAAATSLGQEVGDSALKKVRDALSRREAPVAADIQLRPLPEGAAVSSPPRRGVPWKPNGDHPPTAGGHKETGGEKSGHLSGGRQGGALPLAAQECFQQAEALCQRQRFSEAVPLFRRTLEVLQESGLGLPGTSGAVIKAEVWAHLGVAMQSLDQVPEAIESYKRAVSLDPALHVCFANLATLHAYLNDSKKALEYIGNAIELDPENRTYTQLRCQFLDCQSQETSEVDKEALEDSSASKRGLSEAGEGQAEPSAEPSGPPGVGKKENLGQMASAAAVEKNLAKLDAVMRKTKVFVAPVDRRILRSKAVVKGRSWPMQLHGLRPPSEASSSSSGATRSPSKDRMSKHNLTGNSSSVCPDGQDVFPFTAEKAQHSRCGCPLDT